MPRLPSVSEPFANAQSSEAGLAALLRGVVTTPTTKPSFSICGVCGGRVDGTLMRKYCGRDCAKSARLARRRQSHSRKVVADERYFTVAEVAIHLSVNPFTIRRWLRNGRLHGFRLGGDLVGIYVGANELDRFIAEATQDADTL